MWHHLISVWQRLVALVRRRRIADEIDDEIAFHIAMRRDELERGGVSPAEADRRARRQFGNVTRLGEDMRETWTFPTLESLVQDLRIGVRALLRNPGFAAAAVLTLALGIGVNAAMFSILERTLLRTLPVPHPEALVFLYHTGPVQGHSSSDEGGGAVFSYPMFRELAAAQTPFIGLAAAREQEASLAYGDLATPGRVHLVSGNYFSVLGVRPALGRVFDDGDDRVLGGPSAVVLSHGYWTSRFGGDPAMLNETMLVNGQPMTIVGVAQRGFASDRLDRAPEVYAPITMKRALTPDWDEFRNRREYWLPLFGRLRPGVTREQAEAAMDVLYRAQLEQDVGLLQAPGAEFLERFSAKHLVLKPGEGGRGGFRDEAREPMLLLMGLTLLVLLIACANVANLQLGRALTRSREIGVRLALGASRGRLVRQLLAEACVLSVVGGVLGLVLAQWTLGALRSTVPPDVAMVLTTTIDARLLAFSLALAGITALAFGLYPALQFSRPDLAGQLRAQTGNSTATRAVGRLRKSLVTIQTAVSVLLLVVAGLFGRTLVNLTAVDLGIRTEQLVSFRLMPKLNGYDDAGVAQLYDQLTRRLAGTPGVELVSAAEVPAIAGSTNRTIIGVDGVVPPAVGYTLERLGGYTISRHNRVGPGYFRTLGMPLVTGREFSRDDDLGSPNVAIVNEAFARQFLGSGDPLGRLFWLGLRRGEGERDLTVVGVVRSAKYASVREPAAPVFYRAYRQTEQQRAMSFYVRTTGEPEPLVSTIRATVARLDPGLPVRNVTTMTGQIESNLRPERLLASLTSTFAGLAALLAAMGLYGVLAYNVARRTSEIGIRMALGATSGNVRGLVVRDGALMILVGTATGLAAAAGVARLIQDVLFELTPWDPIVYGTAAGTLAVVALFAAYVPARRATEIDPIAALRCE